MLSLCECLGMFFSYQCFVYRGQESAGIVTSLGAADSKFKRKKGMGLVTHIYTEDDIAKLKGNIGIGKNTYFDFSWQNFWLEVLLN